MKKELENELKKLFKPFGITEISLDYPKNSTHGDLSFFVKDTDVDPAKIPFSEIKNPYIEKITHVGRFINIHLSQKYFNESLEEILSKKNKFGENKELKDEKVIIEYTQPNPFKEFHIGHLMSNAIGESLSRILETSSADIKRANYQGDVGPHVAKAIWAMQKNISDMPGDKFSIKEKSSFIGKAYVEGSKAYESDENIKKEIDELNKGIYEKKDKKINELYDWGRKVSLEHFEELYKKLGTKFDYYFFESETAPIGMFLVEEFLAKDIFKRSQDAVIFPGEDYGLHTRVFVTSQGLPTYETKEVGLTKMKFDREDFDLSIVITAHEQKDYFDVVLKALEFVLPNAANKTRHISHGMLRFASGKMSSREGNVITGESLIGDVEKLVQEKIKDRDLTEDEKKSIMEDVAVGAIKYSILKQSPGKDIVFDFEKSLSFEGDSGPYLQYSHARACSVLRKAEEEKISADLSKPEGATDLEKLLVRFPDVVQKALKEYAPQYVTTYLIQLASAFNSYYADHQIVNKSEESSGYRVALTQSFKIVMKNGLYLLGIRAPEKM